ncbi:MAG: hypothetical protein RI919_990, partial [Actinomycetota bacterium]
AGFSVYADDHRGHGTTGQEQVASRQTKVLGNLGPGGMDAAYEQVHEFTKLIAAENAGKPIVLAGHSYGSFISQVLIKKYSNEYAACVLSGSALVWPGSIRALRWCGRAAWAWARSTKSGRKMLARPATNG